ncbi:hypothetical protein SHKM778_91740 [Streptomyces sp. KM77-8]|uniref:Uncharacterized protein n=1 Tax=Streptomyces haneummycinicus TaxID=3074435 RepID=A0AAT9HZF4_9ACTN
MELVGQPLGEELGVDRATALDHEPPHPALGVQMLQEAPPVELAAERDDVGGDPEGVGPLGALVGGVEDLLAAGVPEPGRRVQLAGAADGDLERVLGPPLGEAGGPPLGRVDQQPGVVGADRAGADQDGVDTGPYLVDPVEVGGEDSSSRSGPVSSR